MERPECIACTAHTPRREAL
ncbi:hypothetical protein P5673_000936 [Acropora cervicornis]|uniref:Uncharacterized protein n=1 Tax=Acropora cervicornis TaxID=6130 RepID=A0AAD9R5A6_ACRCE|nr:hypothetical protein P5673_000936 [Acropora cervicornis]